MWKEVGGGGKWARDLLFVRTVGTCGMHGRFTDVTYYSTLYIRPLYNYATQLDTG